MGILSKVGSLERDEILATPPFSGSTNPMVWSVFDTML
jgi:hypothetical protein